MKPINETHPSLTGKMIDNTHHLATLYTEKDVQKHTIDKAVLQEIMTRKRQTPFKGTEASDDLHSQVIEDIWKLLEKEE